MVIKDLAVIFAAALCLLWINDSFAATRKQCAQQCMVVENYVKCMKECMK